MCGILPMRLIWGVRVANRRGSINNTFRRVSLFYCSVNQGTVVIATQEKTHVHLVSMFLDITVQSRGKKTFLKAIVGNKTHIKNCCLPGGNSFEFSHHQILISGWGWFLLYPPLHSNNPQEAGVKTQTCSPLCPPQPWALVPVFIFPASCKTELHSDFSGSNRWHFC